MPGLYAFDRCEVRPAERQLLIDGAPAALGARAFDLLVALIERHDRVVEKAELFDAVWPGLVVEENNLQVQVSSLRKLLGQNAIATVPGRGYQFVATLAPDVPHGGNGGGATATPNNLPQPSTRFIGREKALDDCTRLLRGTRLLTLSGIGGCGKTRLAQELAQRQLGGFPDGVWFVDLGPLQDAQRVPATVACALGIRDVVAAPLERLTDHLKSRQLLVVLDNCEHVIDAAVESVEAMLAKCGSLKIVATSREVLGMAGEQVFAVRSLSLPATAELEEIRRSEAVRLFVDHARLVLPEFEVTERNAAAIAEICRRLDGIALAIELAAARVRVLSVDEIRSRLDDRFRLLTGGNRAMPRHQTLHATMQWSHDHLTAREQRLFRRLAVFAGGCTLAAATGVAGDSDEYDTLERLTALHDKSLLVVDRDTQAQPRYRMLQTVRQYAEERLNEAGEGDEIRTRHLLYYISLGERAAPQREDLKEREWYGTLRHEQENLLAAHAWCAHAPQGGERALRLIALTWRYWKVTSQPETGYRLAQAALDLAGEGGDSRDRGEALLGMAHYALKLGRYDASVSCAEQSVAIGRGLQNACLVASALTSAGAGLHAAGQPSRAIACYTEACEMARSADDAWLLSSAINGIAEIHRGAGNLADAETFYAQAIDLARKRCEGKSCATMLGNLASVLIAAGKLDGARSVLAEGLAMAIAIDYKSYADWTVDVVAALAAASADYSTAARFHGATLAMMDEARTRHEPVDEAFIESWMAKAREALGAASYGAAEAEGKSLAYAPAMAAVNRWLADPA